MRPYRFANHRHHDSPHVRGTAMLEVENPLPRAELHLGVRHRNHFARSGERHPNVRGAVVRPFVVVLVVRFLRDEAFEESLQIAARGRRGVFHDHEAAARMLDENRYRAGGDAAALHDLLNLIGDFVRPLALRSHLEFFAPNARGHRRHASNPRAVRNQRQIFASH